MIHTALSAMIHFIHITLYRKVTQRYAKASSAVLCPSAALCGTTTTTKILISSHRPAGPNHPGYGRQKERFDPVGHPPDSDRGRMK